MHLFVSGKFCIKVCFVECLVLTEGMLVNFFSFFSFCFLALFLMKVKESLLFFFYS